MLNVLDEEYIRTARAKGLGEWYIIRRHALKNAIFAYPGVGLLVSDAISAHDYPLLQGAFLFFAFAILAVNFIADRIYEHLDPRVKEE